LFNHFVKCLQVTKIKLRGKTLSVCGNNEEKKKHRIKERNDNEMLRFTLPPEENKKHRSKKGTSTKCCASHYRQKKTRNIGPKKGMLIL
jgi:hypothetical protein